MELAFGLDSFEQLRVGSFQIVGKFHSGLQSFGIYLEPFSQFLGGWIVKERNVLVEIRHDQFVAQFLIARHAAQSPADNRFVVAQCPERLHVEQLDAAGLQHRGQVAWAVVRDENKGTQRRHVTGVQAHAETPSLLVLVPSRG